MKPLPEVEERVSQGLRFLVVGHSKAHFTKSAAWGGLRHALYSSPEAVIGLYQPKGGAIGWAAALICQELGKKLVLYWKKPARVGVLDYPKVGWPERPLNRAFELGARLVVTRNEREAEKAFYESWPEGKFLFHFERNRYNILEIEAITSLLPLPPKVFVSLGADHYGLATGIALGLANRGSLQNSALEVTVPYKRKTDIENTMASMSRGRYPEFKWVKHNSFLGQPIVPKWTKTKEIALGYQRAIEQRILLEIHGLTPLLWDYGVWGKI